MNWLLLIHQIPAKPGYLRAKILRRLQQVGAVAIKQSVYALPPQGDEDLLWIGQEIQAGGGESFLVRAEFLSGLADEQVIALFRAARRSDYDKIINEARSLLGAWRDPAHEGADPREPLKQLARLKKSLAEVTAIDFFPPPERAVAEAVLRDGEAHLRRAGEGAPPQPERIDDPAALAGKIWVTRKNVYVDRMASAWLITRHIAPDARFRFTGNERTPADPAQIRFDMVEAEYSHEGNHCTFEVLLRRFGLTDPALAQVAGVIHDIDLKETAFGLPETGGIQALFDGIVTTVGDDEERISQAAAILDNLFAFYRAASRRADNHQAQEEPPCHRPKITLQPV